MYTSVIRKSARPIAASGGTGVAKTAGVAKVAEAAAGDRADGGTRAEHAKQRSGGVQSIERAFTILETLAGNGGVMGLSALATESVSYTHLRAHETVLDLVCRLLLE